MTPSLHDREKKCVRCPLRKECKQVVPGDGPSPCPLMVVGEAPGADEDAQGRPFVGVSGQLLDKMLVSAGFARSDVFVTNVCRCRPPKNRTPAASEIASCKGWLWEEMQEVDPLVVVTLGSTPAHLLLVNKKFEYMKSVVGKAFPTPYLREQGIVIPLYHPSYLLRGNMKQVEDMVRVLMKARKYIEDRTPQQPENT